MNNIILNQMLSTIYTFEDYEKVKSNIEEDLVRLIIRRLELPEAPLILFSDGTNIVFSYGDNKVIKIFPPFHQGQFECERLVLNHVNGKISIKTPTLEHEGEVFGWPYLIMNKLKGTLLESLWETMPHTNKVIIIRELGALIREVHALPIDGLEAIDCHWPQFLAKQIAHCAEQHRATGLSEALQQKLPSYLGSIEEVLPEIRKAAILTGEYTPMNFLVNQKEGVWHISGLIDFGDAMLGLPEYDLLGPGAFLIQGDKQLLREFVTAYGYSLHEMTDRLSHQLMALMLLHQYSNLNVQVRIPNWKDKVKSLKDLEGLVWGF